MIFLLLVLIYILGEFFICEKNRDDLEFKKFGVFVRENIKHWLVFLVLNMLLIILFEKSIWTIFLGAVIIALSHFIIDLIRNYALRLNKFSNKVFFLFEQASHIIILFLVYKYFYNNLKSGWLLSELSKTIDLLLVIRVILAFTLISKSANVIFKFLLSHFKPDKKLIEELKINDNKFYDSFENSGAVIGLLERAIMLSALIVGEYQIIGFVIAAKSIVRFKSSEITMFGEYYIIGTMFSVLYTLATFYFCL